MSEILADIKEISATAAKIENALRRSAIEPEILRAFHIDLDPVWDVGEPIDLRKIRPTRIMLAEFGDFGAIDRCQNAAGADRMSRAAGMFVNALQSFGGEKLVNFAGQFHCCQKTVRDSMASANFGDGTSRINPQLWTTLQPTL